MAKGRDPRKSADRAKMRADEVARQRDSKLLREDQFKGLKGNVGMSDSVSGRGVKWQKTTPESAPYDPEKKKDLPPAAGNMLF